jgi:hypothetical protein
MNDEEKKWIKDMRDFLTWALETDDDFASVCFMMGHDLQLFGEYLNRSRIEGRTKMLGLPRTSDWSQKGLNQ